MPADTAPYPAAPGGVRLDPFDQPHDTIVHTAPCPAAPGGARRRARIGD